MAPTTSMSYIGIHHRLPMRYSIHISNTWISNPACYDMTYFNMELFVYQVAKTWSNVFCRHRVFVNISSDKLGGTEHW